MNHEVVQPSAASSRSVRAAQQTVVLLRRSGAVALTSLIVGATGAAAEEAAKTTYQDHVRPIFQEHCFACHSQDGAESDLALDSYAAVMAGGASGEVLSDGDPGGSRLWKLLNHEDSPAMPPDQDRIAAAQLDVVKAWIEGGLLENSGSERKRRASAVPQYEPSADNRPQGEPAMPQGVFREPVVVTAQPGAVAAVATSPWAPLVALAGQRQTLLYSLATGELLGVLPFVEGNPRVLRFSRDGSLLLVAGGRAGALGVAALFDVKSGRRLATLGEEIDEVLAADISPDQRWVALGGPKRTVRVYRAADGTVAYSIKKHTDWVTALEFSPDGKYLATADRVGGFFLWDAATGNPRADLRGHSEEITAVSWRADAAQLVSASEDDTLRWWNVKGEQLKSVGAHGGGALDVQFARDGRLVSSGRDQQTKLWTIDGAPLRTVAQLSELTLACAIDHEGARVVAADWNGRVAVVQAEDGAVLHELAVNPPNLATRVETARQQVAAAAERVAAAEAQMAAARGPWDAAQAAHVAWQRRWDEAGAALLQAAQLRRARAEETIVLGQAWQQANQQAAAALEQLAQRETDALHAVAEQYEAAQAARDEMRRTLEAAEQAAATARAALQEAQQQADDAAQQAVAAQRRLEEIRAERTSLPDLAPLQQAVATAEEAARQAAVESTQATERLRLAEAEWAAYQGADESLAQAATATAAERDAAQQRLAAAAAERQELDAQRADQVAALAQVERQLAELASRRAELEQTLATHEERLAAQAAALEECAAAAEAAAAAALEAEAQRAEHAAVQQLRASLQATP